MITLQKTLYAVVPLSLEELFVQELKTLGIESVSVEKGGCRFNTTTEGMMKVNLWSRYATRILLKIAGGPYQNEQDIYRIAHNVRWEDFFAADQTMKISLSARRSPLKSLEFVTLRVKDAVCDRFREKCNKRPDIEKHHPDIQIFVHLTDRNCTLYLDTSGESLFKRGWRKDKGEAPLKENLAAGLLGLANWHPSLPLYDMFCGSGTIIIEAATIASGIAPGLNRRFGFEKFKNFNLEAWQKIKKEASELVDFDKKVSLKGSDISTLVIETAKENAEKAGLKKWLDEGKISFFAADARQVLPTNTEPGLVISNPPYGEQSNPKSASVPAMMKDIADNLKHQFANWTVWLLSSDRNLPRQMRLSESRKIVLFNGPLECRFFKFVMTAGSNRNKKEMN